MFGDFPSDSALEFVELVNTPKPHMRTISISVLQISSAVCVSRALTHETGKELGRFGLKGVSAG